MEVEQSGKMLIVSDALHIGGESPLWNCIDRCYDIGYLDYQRRQKLFDGIRSWEEDIGKGLERQRSTQESIENCECTVHVGGRAGERE